MLALAAVASAAIVSACSEHSPVAPTSHLVPTAATKDVAPGSAGVLILASTVSGGASSAEGRAASALGFPVTVVDNATWDAMTAADFAKYRAIIFGDPYCGGSPAALAAAAANATVWGPVVNGNVFIIGSDPVLHGRPLVTNDGVAFATSTAGRTGAYITLSCYYWFSGATPVPALAGLSSLGGFTTVEAAGCFNSAHIVATSAALSGLSDSYLSNWGCSVHEIFTRWPSDFDVLAIARGLGSSFTASDGTIGTPYILARGPSLVVVSDVQLTPATDSKTINTNETLTATVKSNGAPVVGTTVTFTFVDGPSAGRTATATTDNNGVATYTYTSAAEQTDGIRASFVDAASHTQTSGRSAITWTKPLDTTPPVITHTVTSASALSASGWYSSDVTVTFTETDAESPITSTTGCGPFTVSSNTPVAGTTFTCSATSAGGTASDHVTVKLDKTVPTVTGAVTFGTLGANNWYITNVGITWTYSTPGPSGQTPSADCANTTLSTDVSSYTFTCSVTTGAGIQSAQGKVTVKKDAQKPTISYSILGTLGNNGWYVSNVGVNWTTAAGPSGVNSCTSTPVSTDGTNITFTCVATAGNGLSTTVTTAAVKRDATPPQVSYTGNAGSYTVDQSVNITCTPTDNLSGVASSTCANIVGDAYTFPLGTNTYSASAVDNAGNVSATATTSFTVKVTPTSLCALVERWSNNAGVANSLCVKLQHGDYDPFRNEVNAQSGKHIPADKAAILLRLVKALG